MPADEYTFYAPADEEELGVILEGHRAGHGLPWRGGYANRRAPGSVSVICRDTQDGNEPVRPILIALKSEEYRRFFGRYSQLRPDLSPISTWCHVISSRALEALDTLDRNTDLNGYEAAWTGLIVAEASLLADRSASQLKVAACFSTVSYAIARGIALWPSLSIDEIANRYDAAQDLLRVQGLKRHHLRESLIPIWRALLEASSTKGSRSSILSESIRALDLARRHGDPNEGARLIEPLEHLLPSAEVFRNLEKLDPESRLQYFDRLVEMIEATPSAENAVDQNIIFYVAGYLATVVAGGSASLSLIESYSRKWPQITAWAYVLGGIGEKIVWTSSFDGLGRLVARDLLRPLRLSDAPTCDFSLDEAAILVDNQLADPFVHLKIKQSRVLTVSLFPGVNIALPFGGDANHESSDTTSRPNKPPVRNEEMARLADTLWPYLREKLIGEVGQSSRNQRRGPQTRLPFK